MRYRSLFQRRYRLTIPSAGDIDHLFAVVACDAQETVALRKCRSSSPCHQRPIARQQPAAAERWERVEHSERLIGRCRIGDGSGERNSHRMMQPEIDQAERS